MFELLDSNIAFLSSGDKNSFLKLFHNFIYEMIAPQAEMVEMCLNC